MEGCAGFSPAIGSDSECDTLIVGTLVVDALVVDALVVDTLVDGTRVGDTLVDGTLVGALVGVTDTKPWPPEDAGGTI